MLDDVMPTMTMLPPNMPFEFELPARWRRGSPERLSAACMLKKLRAGLDRRTRKVRKLRAAIRCGVYENDLKLSVAADRLLGELL